MTTPTSAPTRGNSARRALSKVFKALLAVFFLVVFTCTGLGIYSVRQSIRKDEEATRAAQARAAEAASAARVAEEKRLASLSPKARAAEEKAKKDAEAAKARAAAQAAAEKDEKDAAETAPYACQEFFKRHAHDPSSVEFLDDGTSQHMKDGTWRAQIQVRARNAFNALRISRVQCRMALGTFKAGDWVLLDLKQL